MNTCTMCVAVYGNLLQAFTGRPARGLMNQAARDLQQLQQQLPLSLIGLVRGVHMMLQHIQGMAFRACRIGDLWQNQLFAY
jgi:predicted hotdog family 3-hydroxylacyl-ACP dehydratase